MSPKTDADEFAEFYGATYERLIAFLLRSGSSRPDADDFAQEAMLSLLKVWPSATNRTAYVYKAAIRTLITERSRRRRDLALVVKMAKLRTFAAPEPQTEVREVLQALRTLKPEQRLVMALTVDGFRPTEIAALTARSPATVRSNLRLARENLVRKLVKTVE
ncbi:RNA polymerase sigma factor [Dactylosporangium vinaceum]|uniref:RNA polymerase sigma factor n=1 Tax=Dactylosporangium vinaceum TaxID=53362 RepID=A0ABV5MEP3_9ACTN|nr:RNA polymerase sigma factor [Dactylosporangium vinaceum]UAB97132.1 RNA polymerase sigma factor [Dactylosporangium vinaceum]